MIKIRPTNKNKFKKNNKIGNPQKKTSNLELLWGSSKTYFEHMVP